VALKSLGEKFGNQRWQPRMTAMMLMLTHFNNNVAATVKIY